MFMTFVRSSLNPCGDNVSADEGHWYLAFYVALFLIHSIWEQVPNTIQTGSVAHQTASVQWLVLDLNGHIQHGKVRWPTGLITVPTIY
jgi:hypothetical protein